MIDVPELTAAQVQALAVLEDGWSHETWRRGSSGRHVNRSAVRKLVALDLATIEWKPTGAGGDVQVARITDEGRRVMKELLSARTA